MHRNDLKNNYYDMKDKFWIISNVEIEEERKKIITKSVNRNLFMIKFFTYTTPLIFITFFAEVYSNFIIIFPEFMPNILKSDIVKSIIIACIYVFECFNVTFLLTFDTVTVCTIAYLTMQFDMLGCKLQEVINTAECKKRDKIVHCINYHCFLIR